MTGEPLGGFVQRLEIETTDPSGHTTLTYSDKTVEQATHRFNTDGLMEQLAVRFSDGTYQVFSVVREKQSTEQSGRRSEPC